MREILFRGKRKDNGKWVYGWYAPLVCNDKTVIPNIKDYNGSDWKVIPETVGQYTGLTDKNGRKVFEGDIVKSCFAYENGKTLTVEFKSSRGGYFPYACGDGCGCCEVDTYSPEYTKVVDNIYDEKGF